MTNLSGETQHQPRPTDPQSLFDNPVIILELTMKWVIRLRRIIVPATGWLLFLAILLNFAMGYGTRWKLGRYCMPRSIVAADGRHYANGDKIDPLTLSLIRSDREEEAMRSMLILLLCLLPFAGYQGFTYWLTLRRVQRQRRAALERLRLEIQRRWPEWRPK